MPIAGVQTGNRVTQDVSNVDVVRVIVDAADVPAFDFIDGLLPPREELRQRPLSPQAATRSTVLSPHSADAGLALLSGQWPSHISKVTSPG
jgi:hypothetical protein